MYDNPCARFDLGQRGFGEMAELVEGARLEIVYTGNRIKGSNPFLSAKKKSTRLGAFLFVKMKGFEGRMLQSDVSKQ